MVGNASSSGEHGEIDFRFLWSRFLPRSSRKTSAGIDEWSIEGLHIVLDKIVRQVHHFGERLLLFHGNIFELSRNDSVLSNLMGDVVGDLLGDIFVGENVESSFADSLPPHSLQIPTEGFVNVSLGQFARVLVVNVEIREFLLLLRISIIMVKVAIAPIVAEHGDLRCIHHHHVITAIVVWMKDWFVFAREDACYGSAEYNRVLPRGVVHVPRTRERRPLLHALVVAHDCLLFLSAFRKENSGGCAFF